MSLESQFQAALIDDLKSRFPGCFVLKNDSGARQGIPDLLVLFETKWAMLEVKASATAREQPNQGYYVELFDSMSFSAFIYPENAEDVLDELEQAFRPARRTRATQR